ncbi:protein kinase [Streptomyces sp. NBC_00536]|uniref:serine/threonine-protein kinase n=1 Tax=Streptomyces sp. NBC_00536 TaxID=2975769 RepID=UPI002E802D89|nr:protein kinase [Streptomyces sp. NBC_00536]WUC77393.1 protein kinase [Streptomyces sp. NBC_00536]
MWELSGSGAGPLEAEDPRRIGTIALAGRLGAGGMGRVYLGVHEGRYVAVKQLLASVVGEDADFLRRFGHELDNLSRLPGRATAPVLASDRTARPPWFATAYIPGLTLGAALELHGGPLPADALWPLLREAAAGLAAVHGLGMVHRDLKPSNVMLTLEGLTLIDFGIARAAEQSQLTRTGMVVGTPAYMAPEQASGRRQVSGATDVFALGSVIAYAASGRPPFGEESGHGVLYRIVHEQPELEPLRALDPGLAELVEACLDKDPEGRPTAAEILERAALQGPFTAPLWPGTIAACLRERAAFAADVQRIDVPDTKPDPELKPETQPEAETQPEPDTKPAPGADPAAAADVRRSERPERPERRRRTRVVLAVLPVVVVAGGTTLAIQYLPYAFSPQAGPQSGPSVALSPPADGKPAATVSGSASAPPSPGQSPASGTPAANGRSGGPTGAAGGPATAPTPASSGGTTPHPPASNPPAPPASGTFRFQNGNDSSCITQVYGSSDSGDCSDASARWTVQSRPDGSFRLVNRQSGGCLYSNGLNQAVFVGDCAQDIGRSWRTGSGGSLRSDLGGGCLDLGMAGGLNTSSCAGTAAQRWSRQS